MKNLLIPFLLLTMVCAAQEPKPEYDEKLAKTLGADEYGMKKYILVVLKTGTNTSATASEKEKLFGGHMENINRLAKEGNLVVAGPFEKNAAAFRGIFILNAASVEEAKLMTAADPAVAAKLLEAEYFVWYGSAALQETLKIHDKIQKSKI